MTSEERRELRYQRRKAKREEKKIRDVGDALDFDKVFTYKNLYKSALLCYKGVSWKASVQSYKSRGGILTMRRYKELKKGVLNLIKGPEFVIYERGHRRVINSIHIRDRVPAKCMCKFSLKPVLHRSLIYDNMASQEGKGIKKARKRLDCHLERHIRRHGMTGGIVIIDFKGFFKSIQHKLIRFILGRQYKDKRIIGMNMKIIRFFRKEVGLILGSENSQDFAISTPNYLDHFIKEVLRISGYSRYMDDGYIIHEDWEYLKTVYQRIKEVAEALGFKLNEKKTRLVRFGKQFSFLKRRYDFTPTGKIIKRPDRNSVIRMRRKLKKFQKKFYQGKMKMEDIMQSINSWKASLKGTKCYKTIKSIDKLYDRLFIEPFINGKEQYVLQAA